MVIVSMMIAVVIAMFIYRIYCLIIMIHSLMLRIGEYSYSFYYSLGMGT
jgi:hypothetical protein